MRKGKSYFILTCFVLLVMNGLCIMEISRLRSYYLEDTANQQEEYLHVVESSLLLQSDVKASLFHQFDIIYPTSNESFAIIAIDQEIVYYRNEQGIKNLSSTHVNENFEVIQSFSEHSKYIQIQNGMRYIVSYREYPSDGHSYIYAIMSSEDGALARTQSLSVFRHLYLFMGVCSIVLIIIVFQILRSLAKKENALQAWAKQEKLNQITLESVMNDLRIARKQRIEDTMFGVIAKEDFIDTVMKLHANQAEKSTIVKIDIQSNHEITRIYTAAILQRMEILKCISCEWEKGKFVVLLLNSDPIQLEYLLRYFLEIYYKEYHGNIDDFKINTMKLRSDGDGLSTI